ncbi:hypothetical protein DFJ77DRAFT_448323 [Powellomyces hirtus]|nr:hypothetical protein DFJ77DRAFT_448323 [Powellomyces hirtus]
MELAPEPQRRKRRLPWSSPAEIADQKSAAPDGTGTGVSLGDILATDAAAAESPKAPKRTKQPVTVYIQTEDELSETIKKFLRPSRLKRLRELEEAEDAGAERAEEPTNPPLRNPDFWHMIEQKQKSAKTKTVRRSGGRHDDSFMENLGAALIPAKAASDGGAKQADKLKARAPSSRTGTFLADSDSETGDEVTYAQSLTVTTSKSAVMYPLSRSQLLVSSETEDEEPGVHHSSALCSSSETEDEEPMVHQTSALSSSSATSDEDEQSILRPIAKLAGSSQPSQPKVSNQQDTARSKPQPLAKTWSGIKVEDILEDLFFQ